MGGSVHQFYKCHHLVEDRLVVVQFSTNVIYVTIASTGNAVDFGDLITEGRWAVDCIKF